jgi:hypothetical protein
MGNLESAASGTAGRTHRLPPVGWLGLIALLVAVAFAAWRLRSPEKQPAEKGAGGGQQSQSAAAEWVPPSDQGFVGSQACASCHADIAASYQTHPMARSLTRIEDEMDDRSSRPQAEARVPGKQRVLDVELTERGMRHHERMYDSSGEEIYDCAVTIKYVVGSGRRATAYLHQRGSLLFMSSLNWYTQAQQWDLAPGYSKDDPRRFDRRVTDECLSCHAGRVAPLGRSTQRYEPVPFRELPIGCENCHGPGEQHIALRQSDPDAATAIDTIVNPARLEPGKRESICQQCHLVAAARIPRPGRSEFDFRPGQRLEEIWTTFEQGSGVTADGRTRSVSHVQQMRESRCYAQSGGRFGCTSCHDPHRVPPASERAAFYRERCLRCHTEVTCTESPVRRQEQGDSCILCHMPARDASNVSHVTQTDHRVLKIVSRQVGETQNAADDELYFFDRSDQGLDVWERDRALGLASWKHLSKLGRLRPLELIQLLETCLDRVPDDGLVLAAVGSMGAENQLIERARECFEPARHFPASEEAATAGLLDICYLASEQESALTYADRLLEIDPGDARVHALRADILWRMGRLAEGIEAARKSLEFNPTLVAVRQWLVKALRDTGRDEERQVEEQILRRMQNARPPHH